MDCTIRDSAWPDSNWDLANRSAWMTAFAGLFCEYESAFIINPRMATIKIVMLGEQYVGKTSLLKKWK